MKLILILSVLCLCLFGLGFLCGIWFSAMSEDN